MLVKVETSAEKESGHQVLLIAAADSSEGLPSTIRRCFSHEISMGPLTEEQRAEMLLQSLQSFSELFSNVRVFGTELHVVFVSTFNYFFFRTKLRSNSLFTCHQVRKLNDNICVLLLNLNNIY